MPPVRFGTTAPDLFARGRIAGAGGGGHRLSGGRLLSGGLPPSRGAAAPLSGTTSRAPRIIFGVISNFARTAPKVISSLPACSAAAARSRRRKDHSPRAVLWDGPRMRFTSNRSFCKFSREISLAALKLLSIAVSTTAIRIAFSSTKRSVKVIPAPIGWRSAEGAQRHAGRRAG